MSALLTLGPHLLAFFVASALFDAGRPAPRPALRLLAEVVATPASGEPIVIPIGAATKTRGFTRELPADWAARDGDETGWGAVRATVTGATLVDFQDTLPPATIAALRSRAASMPRPRSKGSSTGCT